MTLARRSLSIALVFGFASLTANSSNAQQNYHIWPDAIASNSEPYVQVGGCGAPPRTVTPRDGWCDARGYGTEIRLLSPRVEPGGYIVRILYSSPENITLVGEQTYPYRQYTFNLPATGANNYQYVTLDSYVPAEGDAWRLTLFPQHGSRFPFIQHVTILRDPNYRPGLSPPHTRQPPPTTMASNGAQHYICMSAQEGNYAGCTARAVHVCSNADQPAGVTVSFADIDRTGNGLARVARRSETVRVPPRATIGAGAPEILGGSSFSPNLAMVDNRHCSARDHRIERVQ